MIKPTLFVGLGTTGLKILKNVRQLMFEEYGQEGLPIFRYVSIETDGGIDATDDSLIDEIQVVRATIPTTTPISDKLDPNQPENVYNEHLKKWLDPELLNYVAAFTAGAANIRMAGRLCLWENWEAVSNTLTNARIAISAPDTMQKAVNTLTEHYTAKAHPVPVGGPINGAGLNVYIVGSLCGGSCSGMLVDVAYFCRHLIGNDAAKNVYGVFTMFDQEQAAGKDEAISVRAANCFAALSELNYYNHINTTYNVTFPSGHPVKTKNTPFDYAKFVSRSNMSGGIFAKNGKFDEDGLNLMVALSLFADTAGDTDGKKAAILADGVGFPGIGGLKAVPKGEIAVMVRAMASFGLTAVWYPKYRIASAAAYSISKNTCSSWLETHKDMSEIVSQAGKDWKAILEKEIVVLTSPKGELALKTRVDNELGKIEAAFNSTNSTDDLKNRMETFPSGQDGSFKNRFAPGGAYHNLISMQVPVCQKAFRTSIEQVFNTQLSLIDFKGTYGLGDVRAFFLTLDKEIAKYIEMLPTNLPSLNLNQLDFDLMFSAERNNWTKLIFLRNQLVKDEREKLIANYRNLVYKERSSDSIYQSVRNYFLRPVLQEVRAQLGFGVPGIDGDVTVKQKLDQIEANLRSCVNQFNESYENSIDQPDTTAIKIVTNNPQNRVDSDAKELNAVIFKMDTQAELLKKSSMAAFLVQEPQDIMNQMIETYRRLSLEKIPIKNVVEQVRNILAAGGTEGIGIKNLADRSDAYQNFIPGYKGFNFAPPLKIISGHDPTDGDGVLTALQNQFVDANGNMKFPRIGSSSVDHLLFFYQAECGFALDDLASYEMLKGQFDKCPGPYGHSTHQNPDFYNLELYDKTQKLKRWCQVLACLVPAICSQIDEKAFDGVFRLDYGKYVYEYVIDGSTTWLGLQNHESGIKELSMKQNESAYHEFFNAVQSSFYRLDRQKINESIIKPLLLEVENFEDRNKRNNDYNRFLDEVYSNDTIVDDTTSSVEAELDAYFSQVSSGAPEETQHHEAEQAPSQQSENIGGETATDQTENTDGYEEITPETEEVRHDISTANQSRFTDSDDYYEESVNSEETDSSSENTLSREVDEDGIVWRNAEPETEPSSSTEKFAEEVAIKEFSAEQQSQPEVVPENVKQKKQTQPSKEFSVADVDLKRIQRRGSTHKKE